MKKCKLRQMEFEKQFGVIFTNPKLPVLDYSTTDENIEIGSIVEVPLGSKVVIGIVWSSGDNKFDGSRLKQIIGTVNDIKLSPEFIFFLKRAHAYTLSPIQYFLKMAVQSLNFHRDQKLPIAYKLNNHNYFQFTSRQEELVTYIKEQPQKVVEYNQIKKDLGISISVLKNLEKIGVLSRVIKNNFKQSKIYNELIILSPEQEKAVSQIREKYKEKEFQSWLLFGVTGSGKTEVYLNLASERIEKGEQVLILLPEISLTVDFKQRIMKRFGGLSGEWHSQLSLNERRNVFKNVVNGKIKILIGARSALFLPFKNLGLIIVDEEHDPSYKQEETPIYNARDLAVLRASTLKSQIILSSATPSIETWHNCRLGKYHKVDLLKRFGEVFEPSVTLIDMNVEQTPKNSWISAPIIDQIRISLEKSEQILVFLNRRGYAPIAFCTACRVSLECKNCSTKLVYHKANNCYLCHICGYKASEKAECFECKSADNLILIGPGVERIREEISNLFPNASAKIFSSDNLSTGEKNLEDMDKIKSGAINIIIGTQLVAKGYNFPHLKLVVVLDADMGLNAGDHRVMEKSYQVIKQVVGRAGRYASDGKALIQTWMPRHPVLQALLEGHGEKFLNTELDQRIEANVPPHGKFISLILSGKTERPLIDFGIKLKNQFHSLSLKDVEIFGPAIAPISRIKNKTRVRLLIKSSKFTKISQIEIRDWLKSISVPNNIYFSVDIDPYNFY